MGAFRHEIGPPPTLEDRVVAALHSRGLLRGGRRPRTMALAGAAAAVLCFAIGYAAGYWQARPATPPPEAAPEFMLLLHDTPEMAANPASAHERVEEYRRWARQVRVDGHAIRGHKLKDVPGRTLGGFFIVQAPSREAAEAIAATCPHARLGGRIEVREIDST